MGVFYLPIINLEGEREAKTQDSEFYGSKVIEYLQLRDYYLIKDSNFDGTFDDLTFRRPKFDGKLETKVEIKNTDLSLSDPDFLREFGDYFITYMNKDQEQFYMKFFVRKLRNFQKWKNIFESNKQNSDDVKIFKSMILKHIDVQQKEKICSYTESDFNNFISNCEITQVNYQKMIEKIDQLKKEKKFSTDQDYLIEKSNLIYEPEKIIGNIVRVEKLPEILFVGTLKLRSEFNNLWKRPDADHYVQYKSQLYSVKPINKNIINNYLNGSKYKKIKFSDINLGEDEYLIFKKRIVAAYVISKAASVGFYYNRRLHCLYSPHKNLSNQEHKIKEKRGGRHRSLSKVYYDEDRNVNFVAHKALKINVIDIDKELFIIFNNFRIFTTNGKRVIVGDSAKKLHSKFPPIKAYNNIEISRLNFLVGLLELNTLDFSHSNHVITSNNIELTVECQPERGEIYTDDFDYEGSLDYYSTFEED